MTIDFTDLDEIISAPKGASPEDSGETFLEAAATYANAPCRKCGGSGVWRGSYTTGRCFSCKGTGKSQQRIRTDKAGVEARAKRRVQAAARKERQAQEKLDAATAYEEAHPEVVAWLKANGQRSEFAASLTAAIFNYGSLTERQLAAVEKILRKDAERKADAPKPVAELGNCLKYLQTARENGLKYPKLRLVDSSGARIVLQLAGDRSRNPGSVNITDGRGYPDNRWFGRIDVDGKFTPARNCPPEVVETLVEIDKDPATAVKVQGQRTGQCCCCGRELTNEVSIELGIGPICRSRFGL